MQPEFGGGLTLQHASLRGNHDGPSGLGMINFTRPRMLANVLGEVVPRSLPFTRGGGEAEEREEREQGRG